MRAAYAAQAGLPSADPWRHLLLLENLREGRGFTLFAGQPYIWYSPVWYQLAARLAAPERAVWLAAACSALAVPVFALAVYRFAGRDALAGAAAGLLLAGFGPVVAATVQLGAEGFALLLLAVAFALCAAPAAAARALGAGGCFGLALAARLQLGLAAPLFLPLLRRPRSAAAFAAGAVFPLALHWWRNRRVIDANAFVFSWDGLATPSDGYGPISTLAVQLHPSVAAATRALYETTHAHPEWLYLGDRLRVEMLVALALGLACVVATRRAGLALAAGASLLYLTAFDATLSARFLRIWLGVFPVLFTGIAVVAARLARRGSRGRVAAAALLLVPLAAGAPELRPRPPEPLEAATPPAELLTGSHYLVQSGFYHPESVIYRYPDRRFLGMPLEPERFAEFHALYPEYRAILWHGYNVQRDLMHQLRDSGAWRALPSVENAAGYRYRLWEER